VREFVNGVLSQCTGLELKDRAHMFVLSPKCGYTKQPIDRKAEAKREKAFA
jgi:hypothetical protein